LADLVAMLRLNDRRREPRAAPLEPAHGLS
jgi:hypothetical protein